MIGQNYKSDAEELVASKYNTGIKIAKNMNNGWRLFHVILRLVMTLGPLYIGYLVGEMTSLDWESKAKIARLCVFIVAASASIDAWINPQRASDRANRLRNWLFQYRERFELAIAKEETGKQGYKIEERFMVMYQEIWREYNQLSGPHSQFESTKSLVEVD